MNCHISYLPILTCYIGLVVLGCVRWLFLRLQCIKIQLLGSFDLFQQTKQCISINEHREYSKETPQHYTDNHIKAL